MKQSIAWHEECLANMRSYYHRLNVEATAKRAEADRVCMLGDILMRQIAEAKRRGKDGFDADRFMVPKG